MVDLKRSQISFLEDFMAYPKGKGYVLDFSDNTIAEYFEDEFGIDFYDEKYAVRGTSKRHRLIGFLLEEDAYTTAKVLRSLWDRKEAMLARYPVTAPAPPGTTQPSVPDSERIRIQFFDILASIEKLDRTPRSSGIDRFLPDRTQDELVADIERDLRDNKAETALDHLHTYCMEKVSHLLSSRGIECDRGEALHARFGKYRNALIEERELRPFTDRALKSTISLFDAFNEVRNEHSLAHDNEILDSAEARFIFETVGAILVFMRSVEAGRYD